MKFRNEQIEINLSNEIKDKSSKKEQSKALVIDVENPRAHMISKDVQLVIDETYYNHLLLGYFG